MPTGWLEIAMKDPNAISEAGSPFTKRRGDPKHRDLSAAATRQPPSWKDVFDGLDYGPMLVRGVNNARSASVER